MVWRWLSLSALTALISTALIMLHFPAALLMGGLLAGAIVSIQSGELRLSRVPVFIAQGVVGLVIARSMTVSVLNEILKDWHLLLGCSFGILLASMLLGWGLCRYTSMPSVSGVWGMMPGAATAVTVMADDRGADPRLVAVMQCSRLALVAILASAVSWQFGAVTAPVPTIPDMPPLSIYDSLITFAVLALCTLLGAVSRIPAGPLLLAILVGGLVQGSEIASIELPPVLLAAGYATIGWNVGLRFTRTVIAHALSILPPLLIALSLLIGLCGLIALALVEWAGVSPLTAYLATSPGGVDSIAIIAAGSDVDMPFVMAFQTVRFLLVVALGPLMARWIVSRCLRRKAGP